jgi:hypothetical protein
MVSYREKLDKIRLAFPQPVSDRVHDSYFVHSIMRALNLVDSLKSEVPVLGPREPLDYAAAQQARLPEGSVTVEEVTPRMGTSAHADQRCAAAVAMAGRGVVISLTDSYCESSYDEPVTALKSFILSPFTDEANVEAVVDKVLEARTRIAP